MTALEEWASQAGQIGNGNFPPDPAVRCGNPERRLSPIQRSSGCPPIGCSATALFADPKQRMQFNAVRRGTDDVVVVVEKADAGEGQRRIERYRSAHFCSHLADLREEWRAGCTLWRHAFRDHTMTRIVDEPEVVVTIIKWARN